MTSPTTAGTVTPEALAVFVTVMPGPCVNGTSADAGVLVAFAPVGGLPVLVAVFATCPALMSAWVSAYVAVAVTVWPGSSVPATPGQVYASADRPVCGSAMLTFVSVTLPLLVAEKV